MQRTGQRQGLASRSTRVADLRASVRLDKREAARDVSVPPKPPKRSKDIKRESEEDRAIKAEKRSRLSCQRSETLTRKNR